MHEKRFNRNIDRLREPERIARLEVDRVVNLILETFPGIQSVLDVGTGSGLFAEQFALKGLQVSGMDANPEMLTAAQSFVPSGVFKLGTAEKMPFPDASFDLVFMGLLLHETDDTPAAIQEARRVTRKGLAILEWPYTEQSFGPPLEHRVPPEKISEYAEKTGFKDFQADRLENLVLYFLNV